MSIFMRGTAILCLCLLAVPGQILAQAQAGGIHWSTSLAEATSRAARERQLVVAFLFADWCGWCRRMDGETWADPAVASLQSSYVFLRLNAEKDADGIALRDQHSVRGFPVVLLLNGDGSEFERLEGFLPPESLLQRLKDAVNDPDSLGNLKAAEKRNPADAQVLFQLGIKLFNRMEFAEAERRFAAVAESPAKGAGPGIDEALFYQGLSQAMRMQVDTAVATLDRLQKEHPGSSLSPRASLLTGELMIQTGRREEGRRRVEEFLGKNPGHPLAERARRLLVEK